MSDLSDAIRDAKERNTPKLEGLNPGIEVIYRFNYEEGQGPIVDGQAESSGRRPKVRVESVTVELFSEGAPLVNVRGQKLLKNGQDDDRSRFPSYVAYEVTQEYERLWAAWATARNIKS